MLSEVSPGAATVAVPLHVDSELPGFLVEMAALQAERLRGVGDVVIVPFKFGQNGLALEALHSIGEGA